MKNTKCLIVTCGYFGDIAFATSIAKKLILEQQFHTVDYLIGFPQMERLLNNNPYIDKVYVSTTPSAYPSNINIIEAQYDRVIRLQPLSFTVPPPYEYQVYAGVRNPDTGYKLYTEPSFDNVAKSYIKELNTANKKVIAVMANWQPKTYLFTRDQYTAGIDVPNLGYGGRHRDIERVVSELKSRYLVLEVGVLQEYNQELTASISDEDQKSILFECSLMKYCDAFIGTEGGLCNLAAGIGTRTIITGDFVHQLYGWNGVLKQIAEPKLGPIHYFTNRKHIVLNPYLTDEQVIDQLTKLI